MTCVSSPASRLNALPADLYISWWTRIIDEPRHCNSIMILFSSQMPEARTKSMSYETYHSLVPDSTTFSFFIECFGNDNLTYSSSNGMTSTASVASVAPISLSTTGWLSTPHHGMNKNTSSSSIQNSNPTNVTTKGNGIFITSIYVCIPVISKPIWRYARSIQISLLSLLTNTHTEKWKRWWWFQGLKRTVQLACEWLSSLFLAFR